MDEDLLAIQKRMDNLEKALSEIGQQACVNAEEMMDEIAAQLSEQIAKEREDCRVETLAMTSTMTQLSSRVKKLEDGPERIHMYRSIREIRERTNSVFAISIAFLIVSCASLVCLGLHLGGVI